MNKRKRKILITAFIVGMVLLTGLAVSFPAISKYFTNMDFNATSWCDVTVTFTGYHEGEVVSKPVEHSPFSSVPGGTPVDTITVDVSWSSYGEYVDWSTLIISGDLEIWKLGLRQTKIAEISKESYTIHEQGEEAMSGSVTFTVDVNNLLSGVPYSLLNPDGIETWLVGFYIIIDGSVYDIDGEEQLTASTPEIFHQYTFYEVESTFGFE